MSRSQVFAPGTSRLPESAASRFSRRRALQPLLLAGLLLLAVLLLYLPFTGNPLVFDDGMTLNADQVQAYRDWHALFSIRGLPRMTFYWTDVTGPHHLLWWRVGNMLLHALNACLLMVFAHRLCAVALPQDRRNPARLAWPAFWAALLFAVHPVAVFGVGYLAQRTILMATTFSLLAWLAWLKGTQEGRTLPLYTACACYFLAVMCKEHAIMAAPVAVLLTALSPLPRRVLLKKIAAPLLLFALAGLYVFYTVKTGSQIIGHAYQYEGAALLAHEAQIHNGFDPRQAYWLSVITQSGLFFKYLGLWLLPMPGWMSIDLYTPFAPRLVSFPFIFGLAAYLTYGAVAVWLLLQQRGRGVLGFALLAPWLLFMTELSTVRIQDPFVLYRSYLWLPGLLAALPLAFCRLPRYWLGIGIVASFLALAPLTFDRLQTFSDPVLLWNDAARVAGGPPYRLGMERIYTNRGNGWAQMGAQSRAIADYRLAVRINPQAPQPHYGLAGIYLAAGRNTEALQEYDEVVRLAPQVTMIYYFRGLAQARLHQAAAVRDFSRMIAGKPRYAPAWLQRGIAEAQLKQYPAALRDLDRASVLDSRLKQVFWEKGQVYQAMQASGLATASYQRACTAGYKPACAALPAAGDGQAGRR